jgi:hypothetical protein
VIWQRLSTLYVLTAYSAVGGTGPVARCVPPSHGRRVLFGLAPILSGYGVDIVPLFIGHGPPSYAGTREAIRRCSWPSVALRSYALETEMLLHRREISVVMQQRVSVFEAESADDDADGLADRDAQFSQLAAVPSGERPDRHSAEAQSHIDAIHVEYARHGSRSVRPGGLRAG